MVVRDCLKKRPTCHARTTASFTDAPSGEVDSQADQAVPIGFFCRVTTSNTTPPPSPPSTQTMRVQIMTDDAAAQIEVPSDGSPFATSFSIANALEIVDIESSNKVTCQAFSDDARAVAV